MVSLLTLHFTHETVVPETDLDRNLESRSPESHKQSGYIGGGQLDVRNRN